MKKTKQIAFGVLFVLSLLASSVSACVCSHHTAEKVETASCHARSETKSSETSRVETAERLDSHEQCFCLEAAPRVFSKSENVKIEKQAAVLPFSEIRARTIFAVTSFETSFFAKPFYFPDSFYNIKSPRAPPAA